MRLSAATLILWLAALGGSSVAARAQINFRTDVMPVLTKAGCNAGACHGAASGQGGFRLSLLGYDPEDDYWNITREFAGRRVDLDAPAESLVLRKPARQVAHEGGRKLPRGSEGYETLQRWIKAGAVFGDTELRITGITVEPAERLFNEVEAQQPLKVLATFSYGTTRDVTKLALYTSNDDAVAVVNGSGVVTARGRGATSIMVRYGGQVAAARIATPYSNNGSKQSFPRQNFIDDEIDAGLARLGISSSGMSTDAQFLRRVYLDVTGRLPTAEEAREWSGTKHSQNERERLIARLLRTEAFVDFWTLKFADLLLISGKRGSEQATITYHNWLREKIATNAPWNEIATALITAEGDLRHSGPANFLNLATDPRDLSEYVSDILLGTQMACARCHAHPSDRWTREDYYEFAAFFAQVRQTGNVVSRNSDGQIEYPKTKKPVQPKLLGEEKVIAVDRDPREILARWMTSRQNPFFAKAIVNRVWKHLLGRGLVEPVNDLRPTNPSTHPGLLEQLAERFVESGFDLRWLIKTIASSAVYQLGPANEANGADHRFYSHAYLKPIPAQVMIDLISQVTGVGEIFEMVPAGTRATQLIGTQTPSYALDVLGRCKRQNACENGAGGGGLAQALHLINGETINSKLSAGALSSMLAAGKYHREIIEEFYLRALGRFPANAERAFWEEKFSGVADRTEIAEDFLWTLLNCREFAYNH